MASPELRVAVLASIGRNPVSGSARPGRNDVLALELGRMTGGDLSILHAGDPAEPALADYLAYGGRSVEIVPVPEGGDIASGLAGRIVGFDLVLAGSRSEGGEGSGMLPYLLAKRSGLPIVADALDLTVAGDHAEVTQFLPRGRRRRVRVRLPAVIVVHPMAPVTPRYAHARRAAGEIVLLPAPDPAEATPSPWRVEPAARMPVRLKATETKAGHARMLSAIATESRGGVILRDGTPAEKAQAILAFLRDRRLIDF